MADAPTAVALLEQRDEVEGLVVITVADEKPAWVSERLRDMVLTPADAKGLEYQSVCVLDPGRVLAQRMRRVDNDRHIAGTAGAGAPEPPSTRSRPGKQPEQTRTESRVPGPKAGGTRPKVRARTGRAAGNHVDSQSSGT